MPWYLRGAGISAIDMRPNDLPTIFLQHETTSPPETIRRIGVFLGALAAMPKPSWRPGIDSRGIRIEGPGLSRMRHLLDRLGVSFRGRAIVHVAGTSGKGSTTLMIAESLRAAGHRTAAFFSPHLTSMVERFWVCGRFIEARMAGRAAARIAEVAAEMARDADLGPPSYFEATLALLLLAAEEADCEFIVLEAGLGGTFDATNAAAPAVLDVITSIGLDHTDLLGETVEQIARDKAGIITPGGRVITAALEQGAMGEVEQAARERDAGIHSPPEAEAVTCGEAGCVFSLRFAGAEIWEGVRVRMAGLHQVRNAALAAGACRLLGLGEDDIRAGIETARLPCRMEWMPGEPRVILDGAHNRDKARALTAALGELPADRFLFVLGAIGDKDYAGLAEELVQTGERFYVTLPPGDAPRPCVPPETFGRVLLGAGAGEVTEFLDPWQAFDAALGDADDGDFVVVAGSLYLAGELRKRWVSEERIVETGQAFPPEVW
ncbi:bifunctional folylpolyglutamate synthase/dihydrofolate synthase [Nitrospinota bacterium]